MRNYHSKYGELNIGARIQLYSIRILFNAKYARDENALAERDGLASDQTWESRRRAKKIIHNLNEMLLLFRFAFSIGSASIEHVGIYAWRTNINS